MNPTTFYSCPKCGELVSVDTSVVLTSYPPQYSYCCPHCKHTGYVFCSDVIMQSEDVYTLCGDVTYYSKDQKIIAESFCYNLKILV